MKKTMLNSGLNGLNQVILPFNYPIKRIRKRLWSCSAFEELAFTARGSTLDVRI